MGGASYGTEFTHEEINEALTLEDPFSLVPSKDTDGHGTFLAGLAAGTAFLSRTSQALLPWQILPL